MRALLLALESGSPAWTIPDAEVASLRRDFPAFQVTDARDPAGVEAAIADAEILFSWALGEEVFAKARSLRWLHSPAAGVGAFLTPSVRARRPLVTNSRGVHAVPIAEHVLGMLIDLARGFSRAAREQAAGAMMREGWWEEDRVPKELFGKTLGLYGYGLIARETARRAAAFGMRVVALKRDPGRPTPWEPELLRTIGLPADEPALAALHGPADFDRFLEESDAVVITAALTPETEGKFDARAFKRMRPGSWLVNVARGKIVREQELVLALQAGRPAAAGLDVFEREPLPPESALYTLDNVILTPHVSGLSTGYWPRAMALFRANLARYLGGEPLLNRVDLDRGY
jgi:phosphoglycerate dehydrogenase-like enzyme